MSDAETPAYGTIGWIDLTVNDARSVRDFYAAVVGWKPDPVSMGEYDDFNMCESGAGEPVAGVCHARGSNEGLPAQWLIYIVVEDLERSLSEVESRGGEIVCPARPMGGALFGVIRDPAGAVAALYQPA
ncbi:MAG: VOC family protein [Phycisphaerales bacterium]